MKYAPRVYQSMNRRANVQAFEKHAEESVGSYGRMLLINLIDQKTEQLRLGLEFKQVVDTLLSGDNHRYILVFGLDEE